MLGYLSTNIISYKKLEQFSYSETQRKLLALFLFLQIVATVFIICKCIFF